MRNGCVHAKAHPLRGLVGLTFTPPPRRGARAGVLGQAVRWPSAVEEYVLAGRLGGVILSGLVLGIGPVVNTARCWRFSEFISAPSLE